MIKSIDLQDKVIRVAEVILATHLSRSTIFRYEKAGKFPKRIRFSSNSVGWLVSDINNWLINLKNKKEV